MNIWEWVEQVQDELRANGRARLADLMSLVPHYCCDNLHERLDAVMPEALALAKEAGHPWIEVFLRHWDLQSRVLHRHLVRSALPDAVALIERANRPETHGCPQGVCATQDLASCYAKLDGPGYVEERLAVAGETLARITPEWPCFRCISSEYAAALLAGDRPEEVLAFVERQRAALIRSGLARHKDDLLDDAVGALIALGRLDEALETNDRATKAVPDLSFQQLRALDRARILARMGRHEEALEALLPFETVAPTHGLHQKWADAVYHLALAGAVPNDYRLHAQFEKLHRELRENGVARQAFGIAEKQARLALARGRVESAARSARTMRALLAELRAPLGADEALARLEADIDAAGRARPPAEEEPEALLASLSGDPEVDRERLQAAVVGHPDHDRLVVTLSDACYAMQDVDEAVAVLRARVAREPIAAPVVLQLAHVYRAAGRHDALDALVDEMRARTDEPEVIASCLFTQALRDYERGDAANARPRLVRVLELDPSAVNTRLLLARIDRVAGDHAAALAWLDPLEARGLEPGAADWERLIVATILGRWDAVRRSAARLGMSFEGEGPIDEAGPLVRLRFRDEDEDRDLFAVRTGPVTARVIDVAHPARPQRYQDVVVFEPRPLNDGPAPGEEDDHLWHYAAVHVLERGGFRSYVVDGVHPGEAGLVRLREAARALGCALQVRSDETYLLEPEDADEPLPGLYAFVAVPESVAASDLLETLERVAADFEHPLVWPGLAESAGDAAAIERARAAVTRLAL